MKAFIKLSFLLSGIVGLFACGESRAVSTTTANATFKIWGNCEMCKETIEGSLKVAGLQKADWNKDTKIMTVAFDSTKISLDQIEKDVAAVGYDTEKYKGDDKAYTDLPECCQYTRK